MPSAALNSPPVANAGEDQTVQLPMDTVLLDGSRSYDDVRIIDYIWTLVSENSDGLLLEGEFTPRLTVRNLKADTYTFNLTVFDEMAQADDDTVNIFVKG